MQLRLSMPCFSIFSPMRASLLSWGETLMFQFSRPQPRCRHLAKLRACRSRKADLISWELCAIGFDLDSGHIRFITNFVQRALQELPLCERNIEPPRRRIPDLIKECDE